MEEQNLSPNQIYNVDECGICIIHSKCPQTLALKGQRQIGAVTFTELGAQIKVSMCVSGDGTFVPLMIIFPPKNCKQ